MAFIALVYDSGSQNILINDWYACLHVLSKQLAVWNAQFVCWVITTGQLEFKENRNGTREQELAKLLLFIGFFTSEVHKTV